jgi:hypothetical protein
MQKQCSGYKGCRKSGQNYFYAYVIYTTGRYNFCIKEN